MNLTSFEFLGRFRRMTGVAAMSLVWALPLGGAAGNMIGPVPVSPVSGAGSAPVPAGTFNFQNASVDKILQLYAAVAGVELEGASNIPPAKISGQATGLDSPAHAAIVIKKLLQEQAGVAFKTLDEKHVAVSFDPKLKVH